MRFPDSDSGNPWLANYSNIPIWGDIFNRVVKFFFVVMLYFFIRNTKNNNLWSALFFVWFFVFGLTERYGFGGIGICHLTDDWCIWNGDHVLRNSLDCFWDFETDSKEWNLGPNADYQRTGKCSFNCWLIPAGETSSRIGGFKLGCCEPFVLTIFNVFGSVKAFQFVIQRSRETNMDFGFSGGKRFIEGEGCSFSCSVDFNFRSNNPFVWSVFPSKNHNIKKEGYC